MASKWIEYFKKYITWAILAVNVAVVAMIILSDEEYSAAFSAGSQVHPEWMAAACALLLASVFFEGVQLKMIFDRYGESYSLLNCFRVAIVTRYYSAITPACMGGQPAALLRLVSDGVHPGTAGMCVGVRVVLYQIGQLIDQLIMLALLPSLALGLGPVLSIALALGIVLGALLPVVMLLSILLPSWTNKGIYAVATVGAKLRLISDHAAFCQKARDLIAPYRESLHNMRARDCVWITFCAMVQVALFSAVAYAACRACDVSLGLIESSCRMLALNTAVTFLPIPGGMGAAEGAFYLIFDPVVPDGRIMLALVIWRCASYFFLLLTGIVESGLYALTSMRKGRKHTA